MTSYQTLIVKDTRDVNKCWKWSIIVILLCVAGTGLAVTFSFHALLDNFNTNCISGAKLAFVDAGPDASDAPPASAASVASIQSSTAAANASDLSTADIQPGDGDNSTLSGPRHRRWHRMRQNYSEQFREHFVTVPSLAARSVNGIEPRPSNQRSDGRTGDLQPLRRLTLLASGLRLPDDAAERQRQVHNEEDIEFFDSKRIDEQNTFWGPMAPCEYISFVPLIEAIVAIVWVTMFMMCGNGGRSSETFVDEPWRIVLPAFVFFALMAIVSAIHLVVLLSRLAHFCAELKQNFHDQTVSCSLLINQFSMNDHFVVAPSQNYALAIAFSWVRLAGWVLAVAVMTARCFKGTDFELIDAQHASESARGVQPKHRTPSHRRALLHAYGSTADDEEETPTSASAESMDLDRDDEDVSYRRSEQTDRMRRASTPRTAGSRSTDSSPSTATAILATQPASGDAQPAQMMRSVSASNPTAFRTCPPIAEEDNQSTVGRRDNRSMGSGTSATVSNCRRLVNELDLMREAQPKRSKK